MPAAIADLPRYVDGTWQIDSIHTEVSFVVRHTMVSKARGRFDTFEGTMGTAEDSLASSAIAKIELTWINTGNQMRDDQLRSADFFDVQNHPTMTFKSTVLRVEGDHFALGGDLTVRAVTKPVTLSLEVNGFGPDADGGMRAGFSATGQRSRGRTPVMTTQTAEPAEGKAAGTRPMGPSLILCPTSEARSTSSARSWRSGVNGAEAFQPLGGPAYGRWAVSRRRCRDQPVQDRAVRSPRPSSGAVVPTWPSTVRGGRARVDRATPEGLLDPRHRMTAGLGPDAQAVHPDICSAFVR
jgi:polyisoprenoid-binding protein YceI